MKTRYLGLELRSPVVAASSPFTADAESVARLVRHGVGAVVLKSIFEEQILHYAASLEAASPATGMGDAGEYLERYLGDDYLARHLQLIGRLRDCGVPVIGSINCIAGSAGWTDYAAAMEGAGAAAIELNIFLQPVDRHLQSGELERTYAETVERVTRAVRVPVAVKLPMRLTNVLATVDALVGRGARGVVFFNRFFEPDIDIERLAPVAASPYSCSSELRNVLRTVGLCAAAVPQADMAVSTGVHDGAAAVKALLCGARAVQICTAIRRSGLPVIGEIDRFIDRWAERHGFGSVEEFRGRMDYGRTGDPCFQRTQYMKYYADSCGAER